MTAKHSGTGRQGGSEVERAEDEEDGERSGKILPSRPTASTFVDSGGVRGRSPNPESTSAATRAPSSPYLPLLLQLQDTPLLLLFFPPRDLGSRLTSQLAENFPILSREAASRILVDDAEDALLP